MKILYRYTLREGLGTAKLFVGMTWNNITVKIKGGATRNNSKQLLQASSLVVYVLWQYYSTTVQDLCL